MKQAHLSGRGREIFMPGIISLYLTGSRRLTTTPDILDFSSTPSTTPSARGKRTGPTGRFWMVTSTTLLSVSISWCCFNHFNEFLSSSSRLLLSSFYFLHLSDRPVTPNLLATLSENFYFSHILLFSISFSNESELSEI